MTEEIPEGYTRVSEILKFYKDFSMINPDVLRNASERGTRVHKYCELYTKNMLFETVDEACTGYVDSFKEWFDSNVEKVLYTEKRLNCPKRLITGQFDFILTLKGDSKPILVDIKTPAKASSTWQLQTAAYTSLIHSLMGIRIDRRICLMLPKVGGKAKMVDYLDIEGDEDKFAMALELYRFFEG